MKLYIPSYPELSVKEIWPLVQKDEELVKHFPKYKLKQLPNKDYLFTVLSSLRGEELSELLYKAMKKRSIYDDRLNDEYVKVSNNWIEQFQNVVDLPSKFKQLIL